MAGTRVTLPDVAARAGVSLGSASRALHGTGASPAMVERVRAAAAELGYQPDATGRSLRMRKTFQIAFAVADIGNPVYVEMMTAIQSVVAERGYRLVVASTGGSPQSTAELVAGLAAGLVDGLILSPLRTSPELGQQLTSSGMPVVVIGRTGESTLDTVTTDSAGGIGQAVDHLLALGHRRIAFLNGPLDTTPGEARQRGFDAAAPAMAAVGAQAVECRVAADFTVAAGLEAARALLDEHPGRIDALVAANDLLAVGAIKAAVERGLSVPGDLAVTGMDDTELAGVFQPSLTSVSLRSSERGRAAATLLLERLADPGRAATTVTVAPTLISRESSSTLTDEEVAR
ncbi:LacI family transcriptional regulator [Flavimobilis marinus]|uniref:Transcriptional regulator, LacI family n=2 Tax=Flavimobilis marinus TaxID=285351 RepID=A0A1I2G0I8_9MICO|nr:LacI family DNA-binding transcriptional regulator [Flavimobilis marinus]GHG50695.1 LacI family transcriptional regulator [Flavimobilis marinus]SFF10470.1 transcriptional regulator, LacI family [Flavimobilis marinus]